MKIDLDSFLMEQSNNIGKDYWIADINFDKEQPRVIKPTLAKLFDSTQTENNKHYSHPFFKPYKDNCSKSELSDNEIAICDNTGYRSYQKNPISIFNNLEDAENWFNSKLLETGLLID